VNIYSGVTNGSLYKRWKIEDIELKPHWNIAVFSVANQGSFYHTDASYLAAAYLKDMLVHERNINALNLEIRQSSFSGAFRTAREGEKQSGKKADYFLILSVTENERDVAVKAELFVGRTGAQAAVFNIYRAGGDRLRNTMIAIARKLDSALPFRATLLRRSAAFGIIDKGKLDGIQKDTVFQIIKKGQIDVESQGIALKYLNADVVGAFTVTEIDEAVSAGSISRVGFFDLVGEGDEIILPEEKKDPPASDPAQNPADPELRSLLRTLR
jgi:hypothetical protein